MAKRHAYPLSLLFIAVAVAAAILAMLSPLSRQVFGSGDVFGTTVLGGCLGGLMGMMVGMHGHHRWSQCFSGAIFGSLIGMAIGPIVLVDESGIGTVIAVQLGSSLVLLVMGTMMWAAEPDPLWSTSKEPDRPPPNSEA